MGSIEILASAIRIARYFCINIGTDLVFHHSIAYRYRFSVFLCIADTSISILFLSMSNVTTCCLCVHYRFLKNAKTNWSSIPSVIQSELRRQIFFITICNCFVTPWNDVNWEIGTCPIYAPFLHFAIIRRLQTFVARGFMMNSKAAA